MREHDDRLLALLNSGEILTKQEIGEKLGGISVRQVERAIGALRERNVPLREKREDRLKRFYLDEADRTVAVPTVGLSEEQIFALAVAAEASRASLASTPLALPLQHAFDALLASMSATVHSFDTEHEWENWHFGASPSTSIDPTVFRTLALAVQECQQVRIDYYTASRQTTTRDRVLEPYGLAVRGGSWLLVARCLKKNELRDFSLAGILKLATTSSYFIRPDDFSLDAYFRARFNALSGATLYHVRLLVEPDRLPYFHRKSYHHSQTIGEARSDGRAIVSFDVAGLEEIRTFVQGWGVGVTVLGPKELVTMIREEAKVIAERYG